jgi:hypothetical protein
MADLQKRTSELYAQILSQREEILRAFVAQHGCLPDEAVQIEQRMADGSTRWWVQRRTIAAEAGEVE